jgi:hypothetical protein
VELFYKIQFKILLKIFIKSLLKKKMRNHQITGFILKYVIVKLAYKNNQIITVKVLSHQLRERCCFRDSHQSCQIELRLLIQVL